MKIKYLAHSGFLVETNKAYYLFDYIHGELPLIKDKPLFVFASHNHQDHYSEEIFNIDNVCNYYLSNDIIKKIKNSEEYKLNEDKIIKVIEHNTYVNDLFEVMTLHSTDIGVAFVIQEKCGINIYHAGDLNWWHWEGEPDPWNPNVEKEYKIEIDRLKKINFDVAFIPLDPRLDKAYYFGLDYFISKIKVNNVFPMHFWEDYKIIDKYLSEHYQKANEHTIIHRITKENEEYEI